MRERPRGRRRSFDANPRKATSRVEFSIEFGRLPGQASMATTILIGLHVTKCAGTTLATHVRRNLPPRKWYLCSSAWNMEHEAAQDLADRLDYNEIVFAFGHYIHESLFQVFDGRPMVWFTGIREPISRSVSEYHQVCKVRAKAGQPPLTAGEFLKIRANSMCKEFLRAFPTIETNVAGGLADKAKAAAQMFDLIYGTEDFERSVEPLLKIIGVKSAGMTAVNVTGEDAKSNEFLLTQQHEIERAGPEHFDQDLKLYSYLKPIIGRWKPFAASAQDVRPRGQIAWVPGILGRGDGLGAFTRHMSKHYVRDFFNVGRVSELNDLLARRKHWNDQLIEAASALQQPGGDPQSRRP
jgi:hypothetical protein